MSTFAKRTKVPAIHTRSEIEQTLKRYGAKNYGFVTMPGVVMVAFEAQNRRVRFKVSTPDEDKRPQEYRQRWRALLLVIKAKLESVQAGIEVFDEAFMAQIVLPDGRTMAELAVPQIAQAYTGGKMPPLLGHEG